MSEAAVYIGLFLVVICTNTFLSKVLIGGDDGKGAEIVEASISIVILYSLFCSILATNTCPEGVPFVYQLQTYAGLNDFFEKNRGGFIVECAKLILLTLIVEKIYSFSKKADETSSAKLKGIRSGLVSVIAGVIVNGLLYSFWSKFDIGKYGFNIFSCIVGGTGVASLLIPRKVSELFHFDNEVVEFICKGLPKTDLWNDLKRATLNSVLFVFFLMYIEREYGNLTQLGSAYISAILPALITMGFVVFIFKCAISFIFHDWGKKEK